MTLSSMVREDREQSPVNSNSHLTSDCNIPRGWNRISRLRPRFVVFGEIHGTKEAPEFVSTLACALAREGKRVLVAVELGAPDNQQLQRAWNGPVNTFKIEATKAGWADRGDGVASAAMLNALILLHSLNRSGDHISVVAFNGFKNDAQEHRLSVLPSQESHEAAQAENIRDAANQGRYDYVLVLVGAAHARKTTISHSGQVYRPMAMFLEHSGKVVSLKMAASGGTAWNCTLRPTVGVQPGQPVTADMVECSNHGFKGLRLTSTIVPIGLGKLPGMEDDRGYDGYFWLNSVSGSAPAFP